MGQARIDCCIDTGNIGRTMQSTIQHSKPIYTVAVFIYIGLFCNHDCSFDGCHFVEQELLTIPEHLSSSPVYSAVRVT
jgi:2-iminoacetate synthase ThiH